MFCKGCPLAVLNEGFAGFENNVSLQDLDTLQYLVMKVILRGDSVPCVSNCSYFAHVRDHIQSELDKIEE